MAYYMRFFSTDTAPTFAQVMDAVVKSDPHLKWHNVSKSGDDHAGSAVLSCTPDGSKGFDCAVVELLLPQHESFNEEKSEALDFAEDGEGDVAGVTNTLNTTQFVVLIQVLYENASNDEVFDALDFLWNWLKPNFKGISQADGEGFYDGNDLILECE